MSPVPDRLDALSDIIASGKYEQQALAVELEELGAEALAAWERMSQDNTDLYELVRDKSYFNWETRAAARIDRNRMKNENILWVAQRTADLAKIETATLLWISAEDRGVDPEVHDSDLAAMNELLALSEPLARVVDRIKAIQQDIHLRQRSIAASTFDSRLIQGWYVKASTSRRNVTGWVVSGRGNTVHVLPDPFKDTRQVPATDSSIYFMSSNPAGLSVERVLASVKSAMSWPAGLSLPRAMSEQPFSKWGSIIGETTLPRKNMKDVTESFKMDTAVVSPILPPGMAADRRSAAYRVAEAIHAKWSETTSAQTAHKEWLDESREARKHRERLEEETKRVIESGLFPEQDPSSAKSITDLLVRETIKRLPYADQEAFRNVMVDVAIERAGGVLTEAEQDLLHKKPEAGTFIDILREKVRAGIEPHLDGLAF